MFVIFGINCILVHGIKPKIIIVFKIFLTRNFQTYRIKISLMNPHTKRIFLVFIYLAVPSLSFST